MSAACQSREDHDAGRCSRSGSGEVFRGGKGDEGAVSRAGNIATRAGTHDLVLGVAVGHGGEEVGRRQRLPALCLLSLFLLGRFRRLVRPVRRAGAFSLEGVFFPTPNISAFES